MAEKKSSVMETIALERVPDNQRKPWYSIAFIWSGCVICVPALLVGSYVSQGLDFKNAIIAMVIGYVIVCAYMCLLGSQCSDLGIPSTVSFGRAFGSRGAGLLISIIIAVMATGWFGYQTTVCASSFSSIMLTYLNIDFPLWLSSLVWGVAMFITAVYGVKIIAILNYISVPALFILLVWGVIAVVRNGSTAGLATYQPETDMGLIYGITLSVGCFAVGGVIAGDYTRYAKNRTGTFLGCIVGILPAGIGVLVIGAVLALSAGSSDLSIVFASFGLPIAGLLVLILATWTTNTTNAYSAGIAAMNVFKIKDSKRSVVTLICGAIGTILAMVGIINYFVNFLSIITAFVPPVAGVAIADYWIMGRGKAKGWKPLSGFNWLGIISWLVGSLVGYFTTFFVPTLNGIIASIILYCILTSVVKNEKLNPIAALKNSRDDEAAADNGQTA